mmetsp:Transcript_20019/g.60503  ORF Transcript_20019/g.60503 Transcript_20019/m.60503 type:complete len:574 (-) Transcript_20019:1909-3630(-)
MTEARNAKLWREALPQLQSSNADGVDLLKLLETVGAEQFIGHALFEEQRHALGTTQDKLKKIIDVAISQEWSGIKDGSEDWWAALEASSSRWSAARYFVRQAMQALPNTFSSTDRLLLHHGSLVADAYDVWFKKWMRTLSGTELSEQLAKDDAEGKIPLELKNHYTVITRSADGGEYSQVAYFTAFPEELGTIVALFDDWIAALRKEGSPDQAVVDTFVRQLQQYRDCLAETNVDKLEDAWKELDYRWVRNKYHIDIVHDIEYGYGEPLRCKAIPQFSVRLKDATYAAENDTIDRIQGFMVEDFKKRDTALSRAGLGALSKSSAALYFIPYQCSMSLFFRFSGHCIPNRSQVREAEGVKIYFDPVSTASREEAVRSLIDRVVEGAEGRRSALETTDTLVNHVAAHEIGHAIYSLDSIKDVLKVDTKTLLEEPRAELTALHTMTLLLEHNLLDLDQQKRTLANFMLTDLRRFEMWDSQPTMPYRLSAQKNWASAEELGYVKLNPNGKVELDDDKTKLFLDDCSRRFKAILDAEDARDGGELEGILQDMQAAENAPICQHLVQQLFTRPRETAVA